MWRTIATSAWQLAFFVLALSALCSTLQWAFVRDSWPVEVPPDPARDVWVVVVWLTVLWAVSRAWPSLQRPAIAAASGAVFVGPWLQSRTAAWLSEYIVREHGRCFGCSWRGGYTRSVMPWDLMPWRVADALGEVGGVLWRLLRALGSSEQSYVWRALYVVGAMVGAAIGVSLWRPLWRRRFSIAVAMLVALFIVARATVEFATRPQIDDWMRGFRVVDRVRIALIHEGPEFDRETSTVVGARLSDGRRVWKELAGRDAQGARWVVEIANDGPVERGLMPATSHLWCEDGQEVVVREREFPRWRMARCETPGQRATGRMVAVDSAWRDVLRGEVVSGVAMPREWLRMAWGGLAFGVIALCAERVVRARWRRRSEKRARSARADIETPYRVAAESDRARAAPAKGAGERERAEALDQWMIVAIALQWVMPAVTWLLAARYVVQR